MTTLRVYLEAAPDPPRTCEWGLFDDANRLVRRGSGMLADWPAAQHREAVIDARQGRLATVKLPPLPAPRIQSAASFALEDQLAGAPEDSHVATARQATDGSLRVAIVDAAWMREFQAASARCSIRWDRVILESDLASPPAAGWCWCAESPAHAGFVRTSEGSTLAVGPATAGAPPDEIVLALAGSARRPRVVRVDVAGAGTALLEQATQKTGVEFTAGTPWRWSDAGAAGFAAAIDLQVGAFDVAATPSRIDALPMFRPALWIAGAALAIYAFAGIGEWLGLQWQLRAVDRDMTALAQGAMSASDASTVASVEAPAAFIARRHAELRHRAGLAGASDLLPLLARAAPSMAALPPGGIRSLRYADGHIVFELQKLDPAQTTLLQRDLRRQGLVAIAVPSAGGVRLRIGVD